MNAGPRGSTHASARVAAGALFVDDADRVMLVRPTYKDYWDIPGGYVEEGEAPRQACEREVLEELGLHLDAGPLLVLDWAPHPAEGDKLLFIFDGGSLGTDHLNNIRLQPDELAEYAFRSLEDLSAVLIPRLQRRVSAAARARTQGSTLYLENGREVPGRGHGFGHETPSTTDARVHQSPPS